MKKLISVLLIFILMISTITGCSKTEQEIQQMQSDPSLSTIKYEGSTVEEKASSVLKQLTNEQKTAQMLQAAVYNLSTSEMEKNCYSSVLSNGGHFENSAKGWKGAILEYQMAAIKSTTKIPFIYGNDAVHGHNTVMGSVIFPHNIGVGAANEPDLTYKMGAAVAEEMKLTGVLWNFAPCVAVADDPRWGRTYESYSTNVDIVTRLSTAFAKGQLEHGVMPTAKHFLGDGNVKFGTGEDEMLIDRGDAPLSDARINELIKPYQSLIDAGVKVIMPSHSSINGLKMHANKTLLTDKLKGELKFDGFIISDWESVQHIEGKSLHDKLVTAINAGIDMLMQPTNYEECKTEILKAIENGEIPQSRIDDAVTRILKVKFEMGVFDDPMQKQLKTEVTELGSAGYRDLARQLVEKSLVLAKNDNNILPFKKGQKIYVTGPAADCVEIQCGGWTDEWQGLVKSKKTIKGTSILAGLKELANEYDLTIITDEAKASEADITLLCVGETSYAEWEGDTQDLSLNGKLGLSSNADAIESAKKIGKPTVTLIVAGRNVLINDYLPDWNSVVMCYLPGSEGEGIGNVLTGKTKFSGKLPMPWYKTVNDIGTGNDLLYKEGYGLTY